MTTEPPIVEFRDVSHFAGSTAVLRNVTWQVRASEHWALLGPNGAGKTTLLKILCGYLWPNGGGEVLRGGETSVDLTALRRQIGWLTSQMTTQIPPEEVAGDTVLSGKFAQIGFRRLPGLDLEAADERQVHSALDRLGCADLKERTFGTLSQGEQQKVLIARATMSQRKLLILDEPCAGLDPAARESFLEAIEHLAQQSEAPSLLLVTHHVEEIMPSFGLTLALSRGRILHCGPTRAVVTQRLLEDLYGRKIGQIAHRNGRFWLSW